MFLFCVYMCMHMGATVHIWRSENYLSHIFPFKPFTLGEILFRQALVNATELAA